MEERIVGMNTNMVSSKVMLSFHIYSCAIELEYSFHVIILTYELAYSLCVMILTCSFGMIISYELDYSFYAMISSYRTLCLIFQAIYMLRIRAKLRWWFVVPSGVPMSYACQSVGSESRGDVGSFCVIGRGARVHGSR